MMGNETADQWLLVVLVACLQLICIDLSYVCEKVEDMMKFKVHKLFYF